MRRTIAIASLALIGALVLTACGGSSDHSSSDSMGMSDQSDMHHGSNSMEANRAVAAGAREILVEAGALSFAPKRLQLARGEDVTVVLTSSDIEHDFYVSSIGHVVHAAAGKTAKGGLMIDRAGTYKFWCTVTGHKQGGMVGTITVTA